MQIKRGDIFIVDLGKNKQGSEQQGLRPCVVITNDTANAVSPVILVAPISSQKKKLLPVHMYIKKSRTNGLLEDSVILFEQIFTICVKNRLHKKVGKLNNIQIKNMNEKLKISLGL